MLKLNQGHTVVEKGVTVAWGGRKKIRGWGGQKNLGVSGKNYFGVGEKAFFVV